MGVLSKLLGSGVMDVAKGAADIADRFHYSQRERQQDEQAALNDARNYEMESRKLDSAGMAAQTEINLAEAKSGSMFKGGWRPATGWICVGGMGYEFLFRPLFGWVAQLVGFAAGTDLAALPMPPEIAMDQLLALLTALLGLAGYRTYERRTGGIPGGQ